MMERIRGLRDDSGAMLVVTLIIITTVAVVTGALLTKGSTNFRATVALEGVVGTSYAADTSAKVAINNLRLGERAPGWVTPSFPGVWDDWVYTNSADGTGCFGADGTSPDNSLEVAGIYPRAGRQTADSSARVECAVVPGTGVFSGVGIEDPDPTDAFAQALTTVGTTGLLQGMTLKPLGSANEAPMPVRGGIASKSYITVDNGALVTDGYVKAEGACTGQIVSNPPKACNEPGSVPFPPTPPSPLTSVPTYRDPSAYTSSCVFQPGFYNNATALTAAVNGCTSRAKFASGIYYFDFRDEERGTGQNIWKVNNRLIGGEYVGDTIPGACRSPIFNDPIPGVQFVFGGTSRIEVSDTAHVELCGPSNGGEPPLTLYQQPSGSAVPAVPLSDLSAGTVVHGTVARRDDFQVSTPPAPPAPAGPTALKDAVAAADGTSLTWKASSNNRSAALDLSNFAVSSVPVGSDINSAVVRVKYAKVSAQNLTAAVKDQPPAVNVSAPDATGWGSADVTAQMQALLAGGAFTASRPLLELRLLGAAKDDTLTIDAVKVSVTYTPPVLHAAQNVKIVYAPGGNFHGEFVVQGATFAPKGYVDLDPGSFDTALVAFRWGLVASGVNLKAQPSQQFGYPLVSVPVAGHGLGTRVQVVDLKVYVCVEQTTCTTGGTHALTVRVMITDPPYSAWASGPPRPEPGRRKVEVLSWSEQR
jgi:hypothetical protein